VHQVGNQYIDIFLGSPSHSPVTLPAMPSRFPLRRDWGLWQVNYVQKCNNSIKFLFIIVLSSQPNGP